MRYILFGGDFYYANGGANDFIDSSENKDDLISQAKKLNDENNWPNIDWWHVFDTKAQEIVIGTESQGHSASDLPVDKCI